jgi:Reverse transcriptase (RNA-dependent DNA polymerase)
LSCTLFFRVRGSEDGDDPCGVHQSSTTTVFTPIFVKILCNNTPQDALIDTGSAITIIHKCLLNKIPHKKFIPKAKNHLSANCSTLNIIGEILLEINVNGIKTKIIADVTTNLVTNLILGSDWIQQNNVYILTPEKRIMMKNQGKEVSTPFVKPPLLNYPATLINHITLPPFSEQLIEAQVQPENMIDVLFEPNIRLKSKALFIASTLLNIRNGKIRISVINATNRQQTLSEGTKLGVATQILSSTSVTLPSEYLNERIPKGKACTKLIPQGKGANRINGSESMTQTSTSQGEQYKCRECHQHFVTGNGLFEHLRDKCYPMEIREQINKLITHIGDDKQREQILKILWKYGKLFDISEPSKIDMVLKNAIDTGTHRPIHTPPYRKSNKDQETLRKETDKLLKNGIIEHSTSPWSSPVVLVKKKDGTTRFCVDYRRLNQITTKDAFPLPRIDDIYDQLTKAIYFTKFDFKAGYFQVPLDKADRPKTAFSTRDGHFQFKVLPQGLTNGPPTFQRIVNQILGPNRWKHVLAYIDDIIIYSQNFTQHLQHMEEVCSLLHEANFKLNADKCEIARPKIFIIPWSFN